MCCLGGRSTRRRVRHIAVGERLRFARQARRRCIDQDAARAQIAGAVVAQLQNLRRAAAGAFEVGIAYRRLLACAVAGAQRRGL